MYIISLGCENRFSVRDVLKYDLVKEIKVQKLKQNASCVQKIWHEDKKLKHYYLKWENLL